MKVHKVKGMNLTKYFRHIPYGELVNVLRDDGVAFLENGDLQRQTVWKAARRLSEKLGKTVIVEKAAVKLRGQELLGYSFSVKE